MHASQTHFAPVSAPFPAHSAMEIEEGPIQLYKYTFSSNTTLRAAFVFLYLHLSFYRHLSAHEHERCCIRGADRLVDS